MGAPNTAQTQGMIVSLLEGLNIFNSVATGEPPDYTDLVQAPLYATCSVVFFEDESDHEASGGLVEDTQGFRVRAVIDLSDYQRAEQILTTVRDAVVPLFQTKSQLGDSNGSTNIVYSIIKPHSTRPGYLFAEGKLYRAYEFIVQPTSQWYVNLGVTP